jgi:uncharacterized protein
MKLQPDKSDVQTIHGYGPGWVSVNGERVEHSVVLGSQGERLDWQCVDFASLTADHFAQLAASSPELIIFGSGLRLRFPPPAWLAPLMQRRIGVETMDTLAACRTYNILAGEGRRVIAALLLEKA